MLKLNVLDILEKQNITKYKLFNKLNTIRLSKDEKAMNYTNFLNMINQNNKSVLYQDLEELCEALNCSIAELLTRE